MNKNIFYVVVTSLIIHTILPTQIFCGDLKEPLIERKERRCTSTSTKRKCLLTCSLIGLLVSLGGLGTLICIELDHCPARSDGPHQSIEDCAYLRIEPCGKYLSHQQNLMCWPPVDVTDPTMHARLNATFPEARTFTSGRDTQCSKAHPIKKCTSFYDTMVDSDRRCHSKVKGNRLKRLAK